MKQIHLIMPFSRPENKEKLLDAYRAMDIILHPIMFENEITIFNEEWIFPLKLPTLEFFGLSSRFFCQTSGPLIKYAAMMPGTIKRNLFIQNSKIIDDDYYVTVDDDDMYEPGVFDAIKQMDDDIVIISMKRGHHIPPGTPPIRQYPTWSLYAHPDWVQVGMISAQQSFVKGKIFKAHLHNEESHDWDGELAVHHKEDGEQIRYEPELYALFNYYEPGRWDNL